MEIQELYNIFKKNPVISTDSRKITPNSLFFALKGENFDGNKFAQSAINDGAAYAIISDKNFEIDGKTILVDNTLKTLQELAKFHRKEIDIKIVGITGTNGKTTTKELVAKVLSKQFKTYATQGNFNNHIGVPLTLLSLTNDIEVAVVEMGANHFGEIAELCEISQPNIGLITNIGKAHLEGFGSLENLINTKLGLFEAIKKSNGFFLLNTNDNILTERINNYENIAEYGKTNNSIVKIVEIFDNIFLKLKVKICTKFYEINTKLIGKYNTDNVLAAIAVGLVNNISTDKIIEAIEEYEPSNNRSQLKKTDKNTLILDMYNANPTSMSLAIQNFAELDLPNKVLIIGDMLELGKNEKQDHQEIIELINNYKFKDVFLVGKILSSCNYSADYKAFENVNLLNEYLQHNEIKDCTILLKASNGTGLKKCNLIINN
ncbi:MAG: UDP-N-acetylmuramoyl-tripeptide--D-alanyl-D-alanine ligase [Bacteroidales bacterium]|nr:UDP-N-acetylmuramoyl-tripeptide--D-alanyl-D-alanine ligase [Bacteroidales bacterium]